MDAILKAVRSAGEGNTTYTLTVLVGEDERKYIIDEGTYLKIGCPLAVVSLPHGAMTLIEECDGRIRCFRRAVRLLEYSDKSERALSSRLRSAGFSREAIDRAIIKCRELSYLDEDRTLTNLIERYANRELLGPYRIAARLAARGYRAQDISRALSELTSGGEVDFKKNARELLSKKGAEDDATRTKLLHKYGYKK